MPSALVQVADAVTAAIAGHDFGIEFEAERSHADWEFELKDAKCLKVDVVPLKYLSSTLSGRGGPDVNPVNYQCSVGIAIRKKFGPGEQDPATGRTEKEEVDRLIYLVEQMHGFISSWTQRTAMAGTKWSETNIRETYDAKHLHDWRQFTGLIDLTFTAKVDVDTSA
jgi:hypothetical protein